MTGRRTYIKVCQRCGGEFQSYRNTRKPVTCSRRECLEADAAEHNAAVEAYRAERAAERTARPKPVRRPRQPRPLYGDYAWMAIVNGVDPQTGRKKQ
jgi:hypothetical protein